MSSLSSPPASASLMIWSDWLELRAFCCSNYSCHTRDVVDALDFDRDWDSEKLDQDDARSEARLGEILEEINFRKKVMGPAYPYDLSSNGRRLVLAKRWSDGQSSYLFCLLLSHATSSLILSGDLSPSITYNERRLFQACATICAADYMTGPSVYFDFPRPDGSAIREKLREVVELWGEGKVRDQPLAGMSGKEKDGGIDVIAWRPNIDSRPSLRFLLGQTASGLSNWRDKSVRLHLDTFFECWFEERPAAKPAPALFIPFCVEPPDENFGSFSYEERIQGYLRVLTLQFGAFFYRHRLVAHLGRALGLHKQGVEPIDGVESLRDVRKWVRSFRRKAVRNLGEL